MAQEMTKGKHYLLMMSKSTDPVRNHAEQGDNWIAEKLQNDYYSKNISNDPVI